MTITEDEKKDAVVLLSQEEDGEKKDEKSSSSVSAVENPPRNRATAKNNIAQSWASRRNSSNTNIRNLAGDFIEQRPHEQRGVQQQQYPSSMDRSSSSSSRALPVCLFLRNAWEQTTSSWTQLLSQNTPYKQHPSISSSTTSGTSENEIRTTNSSFRISNEQPQQPQQSSRPKKLTYFASVNQHQIAKAVLSQVETLQEETSLLMSVLPSGYDIHKAIQTSSLDRQRAFLLLDLAAIIRTSIQLQYQLSSVLSSPVLHHHPTTKRQQQQRNISTTLAPAPPTTTTSAPASTHNHDNNTIFIPKKKPPPIEMQFAVHLNRDSALLELLCRLGVSLRCTSNQDVTAAQMAIQNTKTGTMVDHAGVTRKPDGYIRRMAQQHCHDNDDNDDDDDNNNDGDGSNVSTMLSFAVDGADEIHRIHTTLKRIRRSNIRTSTTTEKDSKRPPKTSSRRKYSFVLRLPEDTTCWEDLVRITHRAARSHNSILEGVSIHLEYYYHDLPSMTTTLQNVTQYLLQPTTNIMEEESETQSTTPPLSFTTNSLNGSPEESHNQESTTTIHDPSTTSTMIRIDMTGLPEQSSHHPHVYDWIQEFNSASCHKSIRLTVDVSHSLVSHAGALCTRIIGVKRSAPPASALSSCSSSTCTRTIGPDSRTKEETNFEHDDDDQEENDVVHYYIDDGCYGSLQKNNNNNAGTHADSNGVEDEFHPVPLFYNNRNHNNNNHPTNNQEYREDTKTKTFTSTVWGPTCDGLDRVCRAVPLPHLQVDDWLVFPHLGCGGFGGGLGLGTAFNGFEPPDTAYCVLGYFH